MPGFDWDRARWERLRIERGVERIDLPSPWPARTPAPITQQRDAIARYKCEFAALSYTAQLASLTDLRRRLRWLYGSDDAAAAMIKAEFKPLLKLPGRRRSARSPGGATASDELRATVLEVVRRRPAQLYQK